MPVRSLEMTPQPPRDRTTATEAVHLAAQKDDVFQGLVHEADRLRDDRKFSQAEGYYAQALKIFPLHSGYRVQFAHSLKEQGRQIEAIAQYAFALATGAPLPDVAQHILFCAREAEVPLTLANVERLARAWIHFKRSSNLWDAPPIESDFIEFAQLLWGNSGLINAALVTRYFPKCVTRKALFIAFLESPETPRANPQLFKLLQQRGPISV
jgi:tetratricopeptide (TPR) repeat protein